MSRPVNQDSPWYRGGEEIANRLLDAGEGPHADFWLEIIERSAQESHLAEDVPRYLAARGFQAALLDYQRERSC